MKFGGFQKTSLLEYPDRISAIVWTVGCNFKCPFCYNTALVEGNVELIPEDEILSFLKKRKGMLEALSISGGEPLLQKDIADFTAKVKKLGYLVKIDTNGMYPEMLKELIDRNLVDYVSMDVKAPPEKYRRLTGSSINIKDINSSINLIQELAPDYEFRTTFVPTYLKKQDIIQIAKWLKGAKRFYLQQYKHDAPHLSSSLSKTKPYTKKYVLETFEQISPFFNECHVRGI